MTVAEMRAFRSGCAASLAELAKASPTDIRTFALKVRYGRLITDLDDLLALLASPTDLAKSAQDAFDKANKGEGK